jgi:hypothetical protein
MHLNAGPLMGAPHVAAAGGGGAQRRPTLHARARHLETFETFEGQKPLAIRCAMAPPVDSSGCGVQTFSNPFALEALAQATRRILDY